jgi:hypothetical protein
MKYLYFINIGLLFIFNFLSCSSSSLLDKPVDNMQDILHEYVLEFPDTIQTQKFLYEKSMLWVSKSFKHTNSVLDYTDKDAGQIILRGYEFQVIPYELDNTADKWDPATNKSNNSSIDMAYKMIILCRPNKIKIEYVQVIPATTFEYPKFVWVELEKYKYSKVLHQTAKRIFDNWISEFKETLKEDVF